MVGWSRDDRFKAGAGARQMVGRAGIHAFIFGPVWTETPLGERRDL